MKLMLNIFFIALSVLLLVLIRAFENTLFYDPLLEFFKRDYKTMPLPEMDTFALQTGIVLRFLMNTIISILILWLLFRDKEILKLTSLLYSILFVVFFMLFSSIVFTSEENGGHFMLFYVRRFLIHPIFLLILLPAFYFQKYKSH